MLLLHSRVDSYKVLDGPVQYEVILAALGLDPSAEVYSSVWPSK